MANFYEHYQIPYDYNNQVNNLYDHTYYYDNNQQQQYYSDPVSYNCYNNWNGSEYETASASSESYNCFNNWNGSEYETASASSVSYNNWNGSEYETASASSVAYSVSTMSEPKHLFYDPNLYTTYESPPQFNIYYSVQEFNEPRFDEYDPTPYSGGFDIVATYGKPLPQSVEICYPSSTAALGKPPTPPEIITPVPLGIYDGGEKKAVKKRVTFSEPLTEAKPLEPVKEVDDHEDESEDEEEEDDEEEEEEEEDHSSSYEPVKSDNVVDKEAVKALYVPSGYGLEATDLCEVIFGGYFPCVLRNKRRQEDEKDRAAGVSCWESNDADPWKSTSDYIFGDSYPYGYDNRVQRSQFEISSYGYQRVQCLLAFTLSRDTSRSLSLTGLLTVLNVNDMANLPLGFGAIVLLLVGSLINPTDAEIHEYDNNDADASAASSATHSMGKSVIRFDDITFVRTKEAAFKQKSKLENAGLVETLVFEVKDRERIGGSFLKSDAICCTQELADAGSCNLGEVIIQRDPTEPHWPKRIKTFFAEQKEEVKMSPEAVIINKTGRYIVYFTTCDEDLDGTVVRGRTVWKNLDGYLPGETAPLMKFYGFMFVAYMLLGVVWFPRFVRYWKDGIQLHSHVSLVIAFSMYELAFMYSGFAYLDSVGTSPVKATLWAVSFSSARKALSRLLLLALTSGYGLVKPEISGFTPRMLLLGGMCYVISLSLGSAQHFGSLTEDGMTLLMLSWAIMETCFLQWIFRSLWNTLKKLKVNKRNIAKLQLYKNFAVVLVTMVVLNIAWVYVEVYINDSLSELWQVKWMIPAFWYVLAYALLVVICCFWPPTEKPTRYLYVAEMEDEFEEEEQDEDLVLAEAGMKSEDGRNVEREERKSLLEALILLFGNIPRES
ncbi:unnamed protein product [Microthlaspi erraticum]|uniref:GOST seven transmembrane domain-containing protein n=1 Tax=Microthlaspi erraticum TaxID=1685480 RepID=A0A6D2LKL8_9BRAS|nr:unnamed protein product [Microthlaspi erraticum]